MLDAFFSWIRQIVYLTVFFVLILQILPSGKDRKYIRFFAGMIFVVGLLGPVVHALKGVDLDHLIVQESLPEVYDVLSESDFVQMELQRDEYYTQNAQGIMEELSK